MERPSREFVWNIYANPTFAGLSTLIPIIIVDWLFEEFFRRRIPNAVAHSRAVQMSPEVVDILIRGESITGRGCVRSCLTVPVILGYSLLKKLSKKILYVLTIKEATDKVNYYWHQALLIDTMLTLDHLENEESAGIARQAMDAVLDEIETSPLWQLAETITSKREHLFRMLRRARREEKDEAIEDKKSEMARQWSNFADYFEALAERYQERYEAIKATLAEGRSEVPGTDVAAAE